MKFYRNQTLDPFAKSLRKRMTKEERHLWYDFLRNCPVHFRRQQIIGNYIADFYCHSRNLAIELDGSQHFEENGMEYDSVRDEYLKSEGITVLRYSNSDVNQRFSGVCEDILKHLE